MNILLLTANGREHALAATYAKSKKVKKVIMIPGNGLTETTSSKIKNYPDVDPLDFDSVVQICQKEQIDLVDVSQDDIIAKGYVDKFQQVGIPTFGPTQRASQIEWDKAWARDFMQKYKLPIPRYEIFSDTKKAIAYIEKNPQQLLFIKATGLAGGKGVMKAESKSEAIAAIGEMKKFGVSGETFVMEQGLVGEEFSLFAICDGQSYKIIGTAQDHKTVFAKNTGPNTGGMGCVSHPLVVTQKILQEVEHHILKPFIKGMQVEKRPYCGVLYLGGIVTKNGVYVIEFNARWGDPEAEVLLPAIQTDYVDIVIAASHKNLKNIHIEIDKKKRVSIVGCAYGYPDDYSTVKGKEIFGLEEISNIKDITVFGAGLLKKGTRFFVNGGRIFHIVSEGKNIVEARRLAYEGMSMIYIEDNNLHFRTDIGWQDMERFYK